MATITRKHEPSLLNICALGKTTYTLVMDGVTHVGVSERPAFDIWGLRRRL